MTSQAPVFPKKSSLLVTERNLAEGQEEFETLPVAIVHDARVPVLTRWRLTPEDLQLVLEGADIVVQQLTYGNGFHPMCITVVPQDENPMVCQ